MCVFMEKLKRQTRDSSVAKSASGGLVNLFQKLVGVGSRSRWHKDIKFLSHGQLTILGKLPSSVGYENKQTNHSLILIFSLFFILDLSSFIHTTFLSIYYMSGTVSATSKSPTFYYTKRRRYVIRLKKILILFKS